MHLILGATKLIHWIHLIQVETWGYLRYLSSTNTSIWSVDS